MNSLNLKLAEIKIKNTKYTSIIMVISFLTLLTMVWPMAARAAGTYSIKPSVRITGEFDRNSGLTPADESEEYILIINPALEADYASPRLNWSLNTNLAFRRYANNKQLNAVDWPHKDGNIHSFDYYSRCSGSVPDTHVIYAA